MVDLSQDIPSTHEVKRSESRKKVKFNTKQIKTKSLNQKKMITKNKI